MNQIILFPEDFITDERVMLKGRRFEHLLSILKVEKGDTLKAGRLNGKQGRALVIEKGANYITLDVELKEDPPQPLPLVLVMAMARPKSLRKAIHYATAMGVKKIYIIRTWRVEKSYFGSPLLDDKNLKEEMILALEQARDTILPEIVVRKLFKPFVEDELPLISGESLCLVAHPFADAECPRNIGSPATLAIGPEGGFIDYEIDLLKSIGFLPVNIGKRILRVENAIPAIIGRLY